MSERMVRVNSRDQRLQRYEEVNGVSDETSIKIRTSYQEKLEGKVPVYLSLIFDGKETKFLLDSGCEKSVVPYKMVTDYKIKHSNEFLAAANGTEIPVIGEVEIPLTLSLETEDGEGYLGVFECDALASRHISEPILGADWLTKHGFLWDFKNESVVINNQTKKLQCRAGTKVCRRLVEKETNEKLTVDETTVDELENQTVSEMIGNEILNEVENDSTKNQTKVDERTMNKEDKIEVENENETSEVCESDHSSVNTRWVFHAEKATQVGETMIGSGETVETQTENEGEKGGRLTIENREKLEFLRTSALIGSEMRNMMYEGEKVSEENVNKKLNESLAQLVDKEVLKVLVRVNLGMIEAASRQKM
jgi:hypothetical protein